MTLFMLLFSLLCYSFVVLMNNIKFDFYIFRTNILYSFIAFTFLFIIKFFVDIDYTSSLSLANKYFFYFINYDFIPMIFLTLFYSLVLYLKKSIHQEDDIFTFFGRYTYITSALFFMTVYELCYYQIELTSYELFIYPFIRAFYALVWAMFVNLLYDFSSWKIALVRYGVFTLTLAFVSCLGMMASIGNIFFSTLAVIGIFIATFFVTKKYKRDFKNELFN